MRKTGMLIGLAVGITLALARGLSAQALADRVPGDALLYIGWNGTTTPGVGFQGSHLEAMVGDARFRESMKALVPALVSLYGDDDPRIAETVNFGMAMADSAWRHPTALFCRLVEDKDAPICVAAHCAAGAEAPALAARVKEALAKADPEAREWVHVHEADGVVTVVVGAKSTDPAFPGTPASATQPATTAATRTLAADPVFLASMKQTVPSPMAAFYVNLDRIVRIVDERQSAGDEKFRQGWKRFLDASGFGALHGVAWCGSFEGRKWSAAMFVDAPAPRKGLVALFEGRPIEKADFALIPATAGSGQVTRLDLGAAIKELRVVLEAIDPDIAAGFDRGVGMAQMTIGANPITDVLEPLGDTWVIVSDDTIAGNGAKGAVLINTLDDPIKAQHGWDSAWLALTNILRARLEGTAEFGQRTIQEVEVNSVETADMAFGWGIGNGRLVAARQAKAVVEAIKAPPPAQTLADNEKFVALRKNLAGDRAINSFKFSDLPITAPLMHEYLDSAIQEGRAELAAAGANLPEHILPPLEVVKANVSPSAELAWSSPQGFHMRSISPFPGSDLYSNAPNGSMGQAGMAGAAAFGVAILLPSVNRARETANRVKCASNQRQVAMAILLYSNDHKGEYPPDLGTLILTQDIAPEVFVCPSGTTSVPPELMQQSKEEQAAWVNANSDFVFVGAGLTNAAPAERVILHEKPDAHSQDGMNMTFADGHVEFQRMEQAQRIIEEQRAQTPAPAGADPGKR